MKKFEGLEIPAEGCIFFPYLKIIREKDDDFIYQELKQPKILNVIYLPVYEIFKEEDVGQNITCSGLIYNNERTVDQINSLLKVAVKHGITDLFIPFIGENKKKRDLFKNI